MDSSNNNSSIHGDGSQLPESASRGAASVALRPHPRWKRLLDFGLIILCLPLLLPLAIGLVLWVKLSSRGPVIFRQQRIGRGGRPFDILKFRSMKVDAPDAAHERHIEELVMTQSQLTKLDRHGDSRLIPGGRLLRASGLDELPQLLNVLRDEMSIVGPRPCLQSEYGYCKSDQRDRFSVQPGLTGYWQVCGKNETTFEEMLALDAHYARHRSLGLDLKILLRTPVALLREIRMVKKPLCTSATLQTKSSHGDVY